MRGTMATLSQGKTARRAITHRRRRITQPGGRLQPLGHLTAGVQYEVTPAFVRKLLILRTLQAERMHGWAISERIQQISQDVLQVNHTHTFVLDFSTWETRPSNGVSRSSHRRQQTRS